MCFFYSGHVYLLWVHSFYVPSHYQCILIMLSQESKFASQYDDGKIWAFKMIVSRISNLLPNSSRLRSNVLIRNFMMICIFWVQTIDRNWRLQVVTVCIHVKSLMCLRNAWLISPSAFVFSKCSNYQLTAFSLLTKLQILVISLHSLIAKSVFQVLVTIKDFSYYLRNS